MQIQEDLKRQELLNEINLEKKKKESVEVFIFSVIFIVIK